MIVKFLLFILALLVVYIPDVIASECNEPGNNDYVICEDWDIGTPTEGDCGTFPCDEPGTNKGQGISWHDWTNGTYCVDGGCDGSEITTSKYYSSPHSYKIQFNPGTEYAVPDTKHTFPSTQNVSIRFYVLLETPMTGADVCHHFLFFNTASAANFSIDWRQQWEKRWPPPDPYPGSFLVLHTYSGSNWVGPNFNFNEHLNEWVCVEMHYNFQTEQMVWYINGEEMLTREWHTPVTEVHSLIISGFECVEINQVRTFYLDNIVVRTDGGYIGPFGSGDKIPPNPPKKLRVIE